MRKIAKFAKTLENKTFPFLKMIGGLSSFILILMMVSTVADATGRRMFGTPIPGTYEFVSFLLCLLFFGSMSYSALERGHLSISVLTSVFPARARQIIAGIGRLISAIICWLMSWRAVVSALNEKNAGTHGMQLTFIPLYPFIIVIAIGMFIIGFVFLLDGLQKFGKEDILSA